MRGRVQPVKLFLHAGKLFIQVIFENKLLLGLVFGDVLLKKFVPDVPCLSEPINQDLLLFFGWINPIFVRLVHIIIYLAHLNRVNTSSKEVKTRNSSVELKQATAFLRGSIKRIDDAEDYDDIDGGPVEYITNRVDDVTPGVAETFVKTFKFSYSDFGNALKSDNEIGIHGRYVALRTNIFEQNAARFGLKPRAAV